jgi:GNAT superfamily N-acetyltransferase
MLGGQRTDVAALADMIAAPDESVLIARAGGALTGCVHLKPAAAPGSVYLGLFAIAPERQGGGLGKALLAAAEDHAARAMGAARIEMTVIAQRAELIAWYERRGYKCTGETRPFPLDDPRYGLPTRRDLVFTVMARDLAPRSGQMSQAAT